MRYTLSVVAPNSIASEGATEVGVARGVREQRVARGIAERLAHAIAEAQRMGFAEADPRADIDGRDAAAKLSILAYRAFGSWVRPEDFLVRGIRDIDPADCDLAESMGFRIRQIARAEVRDDSVFAGVQPALVPLDSPLARVQGSQNLVTVRGIFGGETSFFGSGAGGSPTAVAVV